jgi:DNA polymerase-3 subunit alpha
MNALYRRTIAYIPSFVKKEEEIIYDLEACEELLKIPTWITVLSRTGNAFVPKTS